LSQSLTLDIVVGLTILFACVRGWSHRSIREIVTIVGFGIGVMAASVIAGPIGSLLHGFGADRHLATAIAALALIAICGGIGALLGVRWSKSMPPAGPRALDAAGGVALGLMRSLLVTSLVLYVLGSAFAPDTEGAKMVHDSVTGDFLASHNSPFFTLYDSVVDASTGLSELRTWARSRSEPDAGYRSTELQATDAHLVIAADAERQMFDLVNEERRSRDLHPLRWCELCAQVARAHSKDMYRHGYFAHVDLEGEDPFERMRKAEISYSSAGENLAIAPTIVEAHEGLMRSADHRKNILRPTFEEVGIGIYDGPYGLMCTQVFRSLP
jgi:uncharacterized protein YkwD